MIISVNRDIPAVDQFRDAMRKRGIIPPADVLADGKLHRCDTEGGARGKGDGAYLLHLDGVTAGGFQNFRDGLGWQAWRADIGRELSADEIAGHKARMDAAHTARKAERDKAHADARADAAAQWESATPSAAGHGYLARKGVGAHGVRKLGSRLLVPMRDADGILHSLQKIGTDGDKRFLPGGRAQGCFHTLGTLGGQIIVAEGYATAATIHEATGLPVVAAFDSGNLIFVAQALRTKYPAASLVIAADDDADTAAEFERQGKPPVNPGIVAARKAAEAVGAEVVIPAFGSARPPRASDFNDLAAHLGADAVRAAFSTVADWAVAA